MGERRFGASVEAMHYKHKKMIINIKKEDFGEESNAVIGKKHSCKLTPLNMDHQTIPLLLAAANGSLEQVPSSASSSAHLATGPATTAHL